MPTSAFKELEISCLRPDQRTQVFYSSGTTAQKPSRHFHNAKSLALYEASLLPWFRSHVEPMKNLAILTPPPSQARNSSAQSSARVPTEAVGDKSNHRLSPRRPPGLPPEGCGT